MGSAFKCTQAQDRIYAVLSLVNDGPAIQPDYTKPVPEVFMEATCKIIALRRNLHIFSHIFHPNETSLQSLEEEDWPTWVPKWNDASVPPKFNKLYAKFPAFTSGEFQPPSCIPSQASRGPVFNLRGFRVGSVQAVAPDRPFPLGIEDGPGASAYMIQKVIDAWEILTKVGGLTPSPTFSTLRCLIWTLLCGVEHPGSTTPSAEEMRALPPHDMYRDFASTWAYLLLAQLSNGDLGGASPSNFLQDRLFLSELATAEYFGYQSRPQNAGHVPPKPAGFTHSRLLNRLLRGLWRLMPAVSGSQSFDHFVRAFAAETILEGRFGPTTAAQLSKTLAPYLALDRDRLQYCSAA